MENLEKKQKLYMLSRTGSDQRSVNVYDGRSSNGAGQ